MMRKTPLTVGLMMVCVWCLSVVATAGDRKADSGQLTTVASLDALMTGQKEHFKNIFKLVNNKSAKKRAKRIQMQAEILALLANVNTLHAKKDDYRGWASQLRDTALELAALAKSKSLEDAPVAALLNKLKSTCESCHDVYQ